MSEQWSNIQGHPNFKISNYGCLQHDNGLLYSSASDVDTFTFPNKTGRPICRIYYDGKMFMFYSSAFRFAIGESERKSRLSLTTS